MTRNFPHLTLLVAVVANLGCGDSAGPASKPTPEPQPVCNEPPVTDAETAVALYATAWGEPNADARACQLQRSVASDAVLTDGNGTLVGLTSIADHIDTEVRSRSNEGRSWALEGSPTFRHQEALTRWAVTDAAGNTIDAGDDWFEFTADGRIARVHTFAGPGEQREPTEELDAWERAWNVADERLRISELDRATTGTVRFTDLLTDVEGREPLAEEIARQRSTLGGELTLSDEVQVFAFEGGRPTLIRQAAEISIPGAGAVQLTNYVRLREGRIERLAGFPAQ